MKRLRSIAQDATGAATIELALLAPILAAMLIGLIDISEAYSNKLRLEQVAQRGIEKVQQNGFTVGMKIPLELEAQTAAGSGSVATLTFWLECNGVRQTGASAYTSGCANPTDTYARFVQLEITKKHTPIIAASFANSNSDGTMTVGGIAGIRIQ